MSRKKTSFLTLGISSKKSSEEAISNSIRVTKPQPSQTMRKRETFAVRHDSLGYNPEGRHHESNVKIESLGYLKDESDVFRAYAASQHYKTRGKFWNDGKREIMMRYVNLTLIGILQGCTAYFCNFFAKSFIDVSF